MAGAVDPQIVDAMGVGGRNQTFRRLAHLPRGKGDMGKTCWHALLHVHSCSPQEGILTGTIYSCALIHYNDLWRRPIDFSCGPGPQLRGPDATSTDDTDR